jgi:site-specific DNA recombinase
MVDRSTKAKPRLRGAVYTRKSSDEGLEQEFNSLDAQREACESYITSQRSEGWSLIREHYDDGGFSGGSMERPALQRLLDEITAGRVDVVVVYKVDRLTRALGDFARIVELFDRHKVSFVSVTQAFNTTTSMGRLTLNVLLSFAQFEREVTGERIRDKIAASKKKGMWMGGLPALGYDVQNRKLVVNAREAETVRQIFRRYLDLKSVRALKAELDQAGIVSKQRRAADGSSYGGQPFSRGALYAMLQNRIYRGEMVHKGAAYPGEHAAIIDETLFAEVQAVLATNRVERAKAATSQPSLLEGLVYDAEGERLTPTYALKKGIKYRYYVSRHLIVGEKREARGLRLSAPGMERLVRDRIGAVFSDSAELASIGEAGEQAVLVSRGPLCAERWIAMSPEDMRLAFKSFVARISIRLDGVEIATRSRRLAAWIRGEAPRDEEVDEAIVTLSAPVRLQQRGQELRLIFPGDNETPPGQLALIRLLARAHQIRRRLFDDRLTIDEVSSLENVAPSYVTRVVRLAFLAPDLVAAILAGRHEPHITATKLLADSRLPLDWKLQREALAKG